MSGSEDDIHLRFQHPAVKSSTMWPNIITCNHRTITRAYNDEGDAARDVHRDTTIQSAYVHSSIL